MESLREHIVPIISLLGLVFSGLVACLIYIAASFRSEMRRDRAQREESMNAFAVKVDKIEGYLEKITEEMFERLRSTEFSLGKLWAEHRIIKEMGGCSMKHNLSEDEEHGMVHKRG
jgi:hypothetical protein